MSCINCCRAWTSEDADADADEIRRESITPHLKKKQDKEGVTSTTVLSDAALVKSVEKDKIEIIIEEEGHKEKATEQQAGQQEENQATKMSTEKGGEEVDAGDYGAAVGAAVGVVQGEAPAVIEADDEEEPEKEHEGDGGKKPATATTAKGVAAEEESEKASEVSEAFEELPKAEVIPKSPSTTGEGGTEAEEGTAVSTSASSGSVIESDDTASAPVAPGFGDSTGGALALPEAEVVKEVDTSEEDAEAAKAAQAVKRVEENLTKGGLLLTQVKSERKVIRRLVFDGDKPALKWEVDAVFGTKWVKVKLQGSRIVCTSNLVKIGVEGESDFLTFEACDEAEAIAVRVALEARAEKDKPNDKDAAATKHDIETEVDVTEGASSHDL